MTDETRDTERRCVECRVRYPHEHRCLEGGCECSDCHPSAADLAAFERQMERERLQRVPDTGDAASDTERGFS